MIPIPANIVHGITGLIIKFSVDDFQQC